MEEYLKEFSYDDITNLLNDNNERLHISIPIDMSRLQQKNFNLFSDILSDAIAEAVKWDAALLNVQKSIAEEKDAFLNSDYQIKVNCHVRFIQLPPGDPRYKPVFPNNDHIGQFVQVKGNVVRMSQAKLLEFKREYICSRCEDLVVIKAEYSKTYIFEPPRHCTNSVCKGTMHQKHAEPQPQYCMDYQEIKIQELLSEKNIPPSLIVTLDNDLVDSCQPGDCVVICGVVERRWRPIHPNSRLEVVITLRAISVTRDQKKAQIESKNLPEQMLLIQMEWLELLQAHGEEKIRELMLKSICPEVHGLYPIKLAMALVVCSSGIGNTMATAYGSNKRGQSHLLLVGDPGMAKSRLLLNSTAIAPRAVHTTGMGCSSAGLTAAAIKEGGEWQLEAGALVLADGGICCIDEFNLMRESDRSSIHEAMEQQTISMAKAGLVCKLSTRCAIIAAANPKNLYTMSEPEGTSSMNIGIASPLLSRFDLVYILRDERTQEWDELVSEHLLGACVIDSNPRLVITDSNKDLLWSNDRLQSHFVAIRNVQPRVNDEANELLAAYYKACRNDPNRDPARTTVRLFDSLIRLTQANARLVFREEANVRDAAVVIRLMESTYGFGKILKPLDVIREELPLSPTEDDIAEIFKVLGLERSHMKVVDERLDSNVNDNQQAQSSPSSSQVANHFKAPALDSVVKPVQKPRQTRNELSDKELDEILSLDGDVVSFNSKRNKPTVLSENKDKAKSPLKANTSNKSPLKISIGNMTCPEKETRNKLVQKTNKTQPEKRGNTDDIDEILSGLDENHQKEKQTSSKRASLDLSSFRYSKLNIPQANKNGQNNCPSTSTKVPMNSAPAPVMAQPADNKPTTNKRNRIFCTPDDDSDGEPEKHGQEVQPPVQPKALEKSMNKLNALLLVGNDGKTAVKAKVPTKRDENDSAYETIVFRPNQSNAGSDSQQNTQNSLSGRARRKKEDLSCLDDLDDI